MKREIIHFEHVKKAFHTPGRKSTIVEDASFSIREGEIVCIVGDSGCGKTTLINMICGLDLPDQGNIYIEEMELTKRPARKRRQMRREIFGLVFQNDNFIENLTIKKNMEMQRHAKKMKPDEEYLRRLLESLRIQGLENDFPSQLSAGQLQRAAVVKAFYQKPLIILADEPTENLDQKSTKEVLEAFKALQRESETTLVIVTHDLNIAKQFDRIFYMEQGEIYVYEA